VTESRNVCTLKRQDYYYYYHRRNNRREAGPPTFRFGLTMYRFPQLFGRSFQKARNFTASSHQNAGFSIWVFKNFPRVIPQTLTAGGGNPLPHPTPSPAFGRAWGASAPMLGPKPWFSSTFQPWLRPWLLLGYYCTSQFLGYAPVHTWLCFANAKRLIRSFLSSLVKRDVWTRRTRMRDISGHLAPDQ